MAPLDQFFRGRANDQIIPAARSTHALGPRGRRQADERDALPLTQVHPDIVELEHVVALIDDNQVRFR